MQYLPTWRSRTYVVSGLLTTAVAVAFSRLYLGYHWLSDVLASWTLAGLWLATVITADRILAERRAQRLEDAAPRTLPSGRFASGRGASAPEAAAR